MSLEILCDIIDELRRDRKIKMSIIDANFLKIYVEVNLDEDKNNITDDEEERHPAYSKILSDKETFRNDLA